MATCSSCKKEFSPIYRCTHCQHDESPKVDPVAVPCPETCSATIYVQESLNGTAVHKIKAKLNADEDDTDPQGFRRFQKLEPGPHTASISLAGVENKYGFPPGKTGGPEVKTIAANGHEFYTFVVDPLTPLKVVVKRRTDKNGVLGATVKLTAGKSANAPSNAEQTTPAGGDVTFDKLRADTYKLAVALDDTAKAKFELEKAEEHHTLDMSKNPDEHVFWAKLVIHLRLKYKDPDDTVRAFPKDFPLKVVFGDATEVDVKVLDDKGWIKFEVADDVKKKFTLKFDSGKVRYLVHEKDKPAAEVKEDPDGPALDALNDAGKQFFALPKVWSLVQSKWAVQGITVPADGQVDIPADGIGTEAAPAELTLEPKLQYARFEFFDRKFCVAKHSNKRVGIPPVVLKAVRESNAAGVPQNPLAGTHDVISNWVIDKTDNDSACQCLPWVITKKTDGADLPKFNNKLLLEFARDNAFVHSTGDKAAERKLIVLAPTDDKRKPTRDRHQYYDLPKVWKSACYFTRFSDPTKNKFFDELAAADDVELEASYAKGGKLTFSLDDIVLLDGASQAVTDRTNVDASNVPLSGHSRITMLLLDPADKHKVKVYKPRAEAAYWSEVGFQKEAATTVRRNVIVDYPINPRVVVFCNGFYDIYDKRTEAATFASHEILGARAALLYDPTISSAKVVLNNATDITNHYVFRLRLFQLHYLHYGATDGTTVFGALVTLWSGRFEAGALVGGTDAHVKVFREQGMALAMERWNEKDYTFEEVDDKKDVKHFCLFEAKDVETAPATFEVRGGLHTCTVTVSSNAYGSSAAATGLTMKMRIGGALDEGDNWGSGPGGALTPSVEYDAPNAKPKHALTHELGHAAIGLWDEYITSTINSGANSTSLPAFVNSDKGGVDGQRFLGMPFEEDEQPLMKSNRSLRVRYLWCRAQWLNDHAGTALMPFLAAKRFRIRYDPVGGAATLKFTKPNAVGYKNIHLPTATTPNHPLTQNGLCDVHLYHLGQDEFSQFKDGGPYTGIVCVCFKMSAAFRIPQFAGNESYKTGDIVLRGTAHYQCLRDHTSGIFSGMGSSMTATDWVTVTADEIDVQKMNHAENLSLQIKTKLQDRFKLQGNGNFSTTYLRIFPQWEFRATAATAASAGTHFTIEFVFGSNVFTPSAHNIVAGTACDATSIVRYLIGKIGATSSQWAAQGGVATDITKDDFPALKTWMDGHAGGRFNVGVI